MAIMTLGEPIFSVNWDNLQIQAPVGQVDLCLQEARRTEDEHQAEENLMAEYWAIMYAARQMFEDNVRIAFAHPELVHKGTLGRASELFGIKVAGFDPAYSCEYTCYPQDFGVELPEVSLINPEVAVPRQTQIKGRRVAASAYGAGGRILPQDSTVVIADVICDAGRSRQAEVRELEEWGVKVALVPVILSCAVTLSGADRYMFGNDHVDRIGLLLKNRRGQYRLVVDPGYRGGGSVGGSLSPEQTIEVIRQTCGEAEVEVVVPRQPPRVPYALNAFVSPEGKVLMTSGDDELAALIADEVGSENLVLTEVPIVAYPTWRFAGIRCLLGLVPDIFFKRENLVLTF